MKLFEAFEALDALNEETFAVSDDGVEKLDTFMQDNEDSDDIVDVIDPEAETEEDIQDSYVGKVILDCAVCHSKIYKDKTDVTIEEEQQLANVGEDCPYCYTSDGFKVIGEVAPFADKDEETDDVKEEEEEVVEESLTEAVGTLEKPMSAFAGTLSNVMTAHQSELASIGSKVEALEFLDLIEPEVKNKGYLATVKEKVAKLPDFKVLTFLYNIILKGDGMGKLESLTESHRGDRHRVTAELFDILSENGFDTDAEDVEDYVFAARDLVFEEVLADSSKSIREIVEQWFEDTKVNYPEDLEALTRFEEGLFGIKTKKEKEKEAKAKAEKERQKQRDKELKDQEEIARQQHVADSWARYDKSKRDAQAAYNRSRYNSIKGDKPSNTGYRGVNYSGGDYYSEDLKESFKIVDRKTGFTIDNGFTTEKDALNEIKDKYQSEIGRYKVVKEELDESKSIKEDTPEWLNQVIDRYNYSNGPSFQELVNRYSEQTGFDIQDKIDVGEYPDHFVSWIKKYLKGMNESKSIKESAKIIRCRDCKTEFTSNDELDKAMYKGVPYYICSVCETPIKRIPKSELDPNNEIEYVIYESKSVKDEVIHEGETSGYADAKLRSNSQEYQQLLTKYNIKLDIIPTSKGESIDRYTGTVNGHSFIYEEKEYFDGHFAELLVIDDNKVNIYKTRLGDSSGSISRKNGFCIRNLINMLESNNFDNVVFDSQSNVSNNESKSINEDINNLSLDTDDTHMEMTSDESGKVTITTEPIETAETSDEVIVPVSDETKTEIENNNVETEEDVDFEEFDETSFDELGESYLKESFDNVVAFRTNDVTMSGNDLIVEGLIKFDSGNVKKTSFTFTAKDFLKEGLYRFVGKNNQLVESNSFELVGKIKDTKFICESLTEVK